MLDQGSKLSAGSIKHGHYIRNMHKKSECWTMSRSNSHMSHMAIRKAGDKPPTIAKHCEAPQVSIINEHICTEMAGAKARVARKLPQIAPASLNSLKQLAFRMSSGSA